MDTEWMGVDIVILKDMADGDIILTIIPSGDDLPGGEIVWHRSAKLAPAALAVDRRLHGLMPPSRRHG